MRPLPVPERFPTATLPEPASSRAGTGSRGSANRARFLPRLVIACWILRVAASSPAAAPIAALVYSPDGSILAANGDRALELRSAADGSVRDRIPCALSKIGSIVFDPNGSFLVAGGGTPGESGEVLIFEWPSKKLRQRFSLHADLVTGLALSRDAAWLAITSADHSAELWQTSGNDREFQVRFRLTGHAGPVLAAAFNSEGTLLVTVSADRSLKVWSTETGRLLRTLNYHTEPVHAVVFSPRPARAGADDSPAACASAGDDRTIRVWQPSIGRMVRIIRPHQGPL